MITQPVPLDAPGGAANRFDAFRLDAPAEIATLLHQLQDGNVEVNLIAPAGTVLATTLWTSDAQRGVLSFAADADDPALQVLLEGDEAVAVAYLENIKLQFDLERLVLVRGTTGCALSARYPRCVYRFQRRSGYRLRALPRSAPTASLRHPMLPEMTLTLRLLDLSVGGCALLLPEDVPPIAPGTLINGVRIELDLQTGFDTALRLQHVSAIHAAARGVHLGCEMVGLARESERMLQRYIDQAQKLRRFAVR